MPATLQNLPLRPPPQERITVLVVSPDREDAAELRAVFHNIAWKIEHSPSVAEALPRLAACRVVLCERNLPDGSWDSLLRAVERSETDTPVIVVSAQADDLLWAEVLNLGGYDVLAKPFDRAEVTRVVMMAAALRRPAAAAVAQGAATAAAG